jgi:hypothetical protein
MPATKSPECLLVMKLHVSRDERDIEDAAGLFVRLVYTTAQDCIDVLTATNRGQLLSGPLRRRRHRRQRQVPRVGEAMRHR